MHILLDIDHTLFNTEQFKKSLARCARRLGVSPQVFFKSYRTLRQQKGVFSARTFVHYLPARFQAQRKLLERYYQSVVSSCGKFLYADAHFFIQWAAREGHQITIYTYGNRNTQISKIKALKKYRSLERMIITADRTKRQDFKKCLGKADPSQFVWVDDFEEIPVQDPCFSRCRLIALRRTRSSQKYAILTARNLSQAARLIANF